MAFHVPEKYRLRTGELATDASYGNNGGFILPGPMRTLHAIASDGIGWEHVSVSAEHSCPTWEEMSWAKNLFWDHEDCVVQYHPPESDYVNFHPHCLHLWRPTDVRMPRPPAFAIGPIVLDGPQSKGGARR